MIAIQEVFKRLCPQFFFFTKLISGVEVELTSIKHGPKDLKNECEIAIGTFKIGYLNVQLINARVSSIEAKLQELGTSEDVTLLLGEIPDDDSGILSKLFTNSAFSNVAFLKIPYAVCSLYLPLNKNQKTIIIIEWAMYWAMSGHNLSSRVFQV